MVQPQRGQSVLLPPQVVPQLEQVQLVRQVLQLLQLLQLLQVLQLLQPLQAQLLLQPAFCGNRGRVKNSSDTFSANSSQGGIWQKP